MDKNATIKPACENAVTLSDEIHNQLTVLTCHVGALNRIADRVNSRPCAEEEKRADYSEQTELISMMRLNANTLYELNNRLSDVISMLAVDLGVDL